jgi:hypothetical protein
MNVQAKTEGRWQLLALQVVGGNGWKCNNAKKKE